MNKSGSLNLLIMNTAARTHALNAIQIPGVYAEKYASPKEYAHLVEWASNDQCREAIDQFRNSTQPSDESKLNCIQTFKPDASPSRPPKP